MKPRNFLLVTLGVLAISGAVYVAAFLVAVRQPVWPYHWLRNVYAVKEQLASESPAPRCLILGGSSALFGFQSGLIEDATGFHVINLGMHAEVPLEFQLWQAERHLKRGDTVLLADELRYYWPREEPYTTYAATEILLMAPDYWRQVSWREQYRLFRAVPPSHVAAGFASWMGRGRAAYQENLALSSTETLMANLRAQWTGTAPAKILPYYNYLELNRHGDIVRARSTMTHPHEDYGLRAAHAEDPAVWAPLSGFAQRMRDRGVRCLATWPPFERHEGFDFNAAPVRANLEFLRGKLTQSGWQVVGEPEDAAMTSESFYDTPYHLTTDAAKRRTERLIERMRVAENGR